MKSKVHESEKLMSITRSCIRGLKDVQIDWLQPESCSTDIDNRRLVAAEISSLRKELDDSDIKIRNLNKSFHSYDKDMNELSCTKAADYVKELVNKRVASQSLQSKLQLCRIERLKAMHGLPSILIDHGGFFLQSFIVQSNSTAGLLISNTLKNAKISKNQMFLDIDVLTAFTFVLSGETYLTYRSLTTIAQEIQKTAALLHTLLDVIQEVELANLELRNLTWSRFCLPSAGKLDLQLCFTDFSSCSRVTMRIDISCLKWGVYPSQVLPYDVQVRAARKVEYYELLVADIQTAVQGVKCGYTRIISICRCVSRMIQANSRSEDDT